MISLILPTLGNRDHELKRLFHSLDHQTFKDFEIIIVSQANHQDIEKLLLDVTFKYQHVKLTKKGLSNARNEGLLYVQGDIITFSDDDCWYPGDAFEMVDSYFKNNAASLVSFQIFDPIQNVYYKEYPSTPLNEVPTRQLFKKSSIEIFVNLNRVRIEDIQFDIDFGLGAKYPSGEENIFLFDIYKKGYKMSYEPKVVVNHKKPELSSRLTKKQVIGKGPMFKRIFNTPIAILLVIAFFIKKYKNIDRPVHVFLETLKETMNYRI